MATFTVTTPQNIDELTSKGSGDIYNINGGYLTIDQDSRYGLNNTTSTPINRIVISSTLGGTCLIDGRKVRIIPYDGGNAANAPAPNTIVSTSGGASGKLIGFYSSLTVAPTATGAATPVSGYIKIKQWNDTSYSDNEALTFSAGTVTCNVNGTDAVGWIEIVTEEGSTAQPALAVTCPRLGSFEMRGEWFELGATNGSANQQFQVPSNGGNTYIPGIFIEKTIGEEDFEFYPNAGSATNIAFDSLRGRYCWIDNTGLVRLGHNGSADMGYVPISGLRVVVGNIITSHCTTAARTVNVTPNATIANRFELGLSTGSGGVYYFDKVNLAWYLFLNQCYSITVSNTGLFESMTITECASSVVLNRLGIGQSAAISLTPITLSFNFSGGTVSDCVFTRSANGSSGHYIMSVADCADWVFTDCKWISPGVRGHASTGCMTLVRLYNGEFSNCIFQNQCLITTCTNLTYTDSKYYDHPYLNALATFGQYVWSLASNCSNIMLDGLDFGGLYMTQPYNGILVINAAGNSKIRLRNIGTYEAPLSLGSPRVDDATWSRAAAVATVTSVAHGLVTGDTIYVPVSSDTGAISVAAKTLTGTPTADTFTFACTNSGSTSGTICYFGTKAANVFVLAASAASNDIKIQRVYAPHTRTNLYTADNSSRDILLANLFSDYLNVPVFAYLNGYTRNVSGTPTFAAQTAVYGTHWFNGYVCDVASSNSATWTRSGSTITVTSAGHSLRTGLPISVIVSSDSTAATLGYRTITATSSSTFTFTGAATGDASGTLTYRVGNGRISIMMNEPTAETDHLVSYDSGTPKFTSVGSLYMPIIGDQVTFTTPEYILGQGDSFPNMEAVMAGGTLTNYYISYSIDKNDGNGYGSFHSLSYPRTGAGGSNGSTTITMSDTTGVEVGDYVWGTNVGPNTTVVSIDSGTAITVTNPNIGTVSGILRFNHLPVESSLDPSTGIKLKIRIKTSTTNSTAITNLYFWSESTTTGRAYQYALDVGTVQLTGLVTGSRVKATKASNGDLLFNGAESGGSVSFETDYIGAVNLEARKASSAPYYKPFVTQVTTVSDTIVSAVALQVED